MDIILKQDIAGLGEEGDVKTVADGYARNFLIPKGMALHKTSNNLRWLQRQETVIKNRKVEKQQKAKDLAGQLADKQVTVKGKTSSGNKLYGSIHSIQIETALAELGIIVDHRKIEIHDPIKSLGDYVVNIKLYEGVVTKLKVKVVSLEGEEATDEVYTPSVKPAQAADEAVALAAADDAPAPADAAPDAAVAATEDSAGAV